MQSTQPMASGSWMKITIDEYRWWDILINFYAELWCICKRGILSNKMLLFVVHTHCLASFRVPEFRPFKVRESRDLDCKYDKLG